MMEKNKLLFCGISAIVAFVIIFVLVNYGIVRGADVSVFRAINSTLNVQSLNWFFVALSQYGRAYFWIAVVALMWVLGKTKEKKAAMLLAIVFILIIIIGLAAKGVYYRPRPFLTLSGVNTLMPLDTDSSFPSGHAMIVMGGAVMALLFLKKRYSIPLLAEALLVCYSRIYVGFHYPTDVLAGAFLGAGIALITVYLLKDSSLFNKVFSAIDTIYNRIIHLGKISR